MLRLSQCQQPAASAHTSMQPHWTAAPVTQLSTHLVRPRRIMSKRMASHAAAHHIMFTLPTSQCVPGTSSLSLLVLVMVSIISRARLISAVASSVW